MRPAARRALLGAAAVLLLGGALLWLWDDARGEYYTHLTLLTIPRV